MASTLYTKGLENFLKGNINWGSATIKCLIADAAEYTPNTATDDALNDVPATARVSTITLTSGKTSTDGVADASDVTMSTVTGDPCEYLVLFLNGTAESNSYLIALWTASDTTGLPVTPNGGNIQIAWDSGANKIFKLG